MCDGKCGQEEGQDGADLNFVDHHYMMVSVEIPPTAKNGPLELIVMYV